MDFFIGTDVNLKIVLQRDGEPFIPDVGSVKYTVHDHTGAPISGLQDVDVVTTTTTFAVSVNVPAAQNQVAVQRKFERRTVVVTCSRDGVAHRQIGTYRLVPFANYSVTTAQVRSFIGVQEKELEDEDVDLFAAFLFVEEDFGAANLIDALNSGTTREIAANECIKLRAVLEVLPSVKQRIAQQESHGTIGFQRASITDLNGVETAARDRYYSAKMAALGLTEGTITLVLTTTDADPITGG